MNEVLHDQAIRVARQHIHTAKLLGVEAVPCRCVSTAGALQKISPAQVNIPAVDPAEKPSQSTVKADALAALRERYERESTVMKTIQGWNTIVFGDGDPDAALMFIGEAPGADEDASGTPFVGRAGQKLNEMIIAMGLQRDEVYITNVLKVRPPNNRTPTPDETHADGVFLEAQINIIAPRIIVTLGKPASNFLLGSNDSMGSMRGRWHDWHGVPLMPTYHPAYLLRSYTPENRRRIWSDLQQVVHRLGTAHGDSE